MVNNKNYFSKQQHSTTLKSSLLLVTSTTSINIIPLYLLFFGLLLTVGYCETFPIIQDTTCNTASTAATTPTITATAAATPTITATAAAPSINTISDLLSKAHTVSTTMFPPFYKESIIFEKLLDLCYNLQDTRLTTTHLNAVTNCVASTITITVPSTVTATETIYTQVDILKEFNFTINRLLDLLEGMVNLIQTITSVLGKILDNYQATTETYVNAELFGAVSIVTQIAK
jgi:hypothetical protein